MGFVIGTGIEAGNFVAGNKISGKLGMKTGF